ncbi:hypothetical protein ACIRD6_35555 [Streptomyces sp. NPDC102473]|uniref:hypothetical protein n=1 Tax=Streptomyces sp. NPDC102473 TaxID=3366180 RepID=UPI00380428F4
MTTETPGAELRDHIADALADADGWEWAPGFDKRRSPSYQEFQRQADAVLAVLPEFDPARRILGTTEQADTETAPEVEAHPAEHRWSAELHDPLADEWLPGSRYLVRDRAVNALNHGRKIAPTWKDGTPTERRLVRETTTYTVEPEAAEAQQPTPAPAEAHACDNCDGIDPDTCLANPERTTPAPAEETKPEGPPVVAWSSVGSLFCTSCCDGHPDYRAARVTSLPYGGTCDECGTDIPATPAPAEETK